MQEADCWKWKARQSRVSIMVRTWGKRLGHSALDPSSLLLGRFTEFRQNLQLRAPWQGLVKFTNKGLS